MKKILSVILIGLTLIILSPTIKAIAQEPIKQEETYSGFINAIEAYARYGGSYDIKTGNYSYMVETDKFWVVVTLTTTEFKVLEVITINKESGLALLFQYSPEHKQAIIVLGLVTPFGFLAIMDPTIAMDKNQSEKLASYVLPILRDIDFEANIRDRSINSF